MSKSPDERGRLYLPTDVRDRFGETYRIVELPSHVALFPVDDDPLKGLREAVGDAFNETDSEELKEQARRSISEEIETETEVRRTNRER